MSRLRYAQRLDLIKLTIFLVVAVFFTVWVAAVTGEVRLRDTSTYRAVFKDVSGLEKGDEVRIAGVNVGAVSKIEVKEDSTVLVTFDVDSSQQLDQGTAATIQYRNLIGDRIVQLSRTEKEAAPMQAGATIPVARTASALDLDTLLNGFKPLFAGLSPTQVNEVSGQLIRVLQGQESAVSTLVRQVGSFTTTLADREAVITGVITNLNSVVGEFDENRETVGALIDNLEGVVTGLSKQDDQLLDAAARIDTAAVEATALLGDAKDDIATDLVGLEATARGLNEEAATLDNLLDTLPLHYRKILNTASYGNFFNFFLCGVRIQVGDTKAPVSLPWIYSDVARCQR